MEMNRFDHEGFGDFSTVKSSSDKEE